MNKLSREDEAIHDRFSEYGRNAKEWMKKCILLLPKIDENKIWKQKGFTSLYEYAAKIAGMSRDKVNEGLRILRKTENLPAIRKVIEAKGVFAVKPVVNIANSKTDSFWAKRALEMNKNTLETFVRDYKKEHAFHGRPRTGSPTENDLYQPNSVLENQENPDGKSRRDMEDDYNKNDHNNVHSAYNYTDNHDRRNINNLKSPDAKVQLSMKLDPEIADKLKEIKGNGDWNEAMRKLLKYARKELKAERESIEIEEKLRVEELRRIKPEAKATHSRTISVNVREYLKKRSMGKCEHPNCSKPAKHIHHLTPFALRKIHDPDKLVYLCEEHHRIIHLGYIDDSQISPEEGKAPIEPFTAKRISTELSLAKKISVEQAFSEQVAKRSRTESAFNTWKQIEKLPVYDMKNTINKRIAEFRKNKLNMEPSTHDYAIR